MRYRITMNNRTEFYVTTSSPVNIDALTNARWYSFRLNSDRLVYLNIAQISAIEVI